MEKNINSLYEKSTTIWNTKCKLCCKYEGSTLHAFFVKLNAETYKKKIKSKIGLRPVNKIYVYYISILIIESLTCV